MIVILIGSVHWLKAHSYSTTMMIVLTQVLIVVESMATMMKVILIEVFIVVEEMRQQ